MILHQTIRLNLLLTTLVCSWALTACQPSTVAPTLFPTPPAAKPALPHGGASRSEVEEAVTPSPGPDVLIQPDQFDQPIIVQIEQTLAIVSPDPAAEWRVEFDPDLFEPQASDQTGWRFKAVAAGQGQIVLTSVVNCDQPQPCPLMPRQITLMIEIK